MKMPIIYRPLILLALCFVLLGVSYTVCDAQVTANANPDGIVTLTGWTGSRNIFRNTSPLLGRDVADLADLLVANHASGWTDSDTGNGTEYYYAVDADGDGAIEASETASAIADGAPPRIENIAALPSPFSPNGDGLEDTTMIFFTLTEATWVTLKIYTEDDDVTPIAILLDGNELLNPGDNFILWDGSDDTDVVDGIANDARYLYRFDAAANRDVAGNTLIQDISGDVIVLTASFELTDISVTPTPFSPNGDKIHDCTYISYEITADADYVAGNIFAVVDGEQQIVHQVYVYHPWYSWDANVGLHGEWVRKCEEERVKNGIRAGLSTEKYYLIPDNKTIGPPVGDYPFPIDAPYPVDAQTIDDYRDNYSSANWIPKTFDLVWCGEGATDATTYIISMEAARTDGSKTLAKTHEIIIENPTIIPNDKAAPLVLFTFPREDSVYNVQLSYVQAFLTDGQGSGVDFGNCTIACLGPAGENIPGQQSNDGSSALTWHFQDALADDGSDDGIYTIVVTAVDYANNRSDEMRFQFEYNMRSNDLFPPAVSGLPQAISEDIIYMFSNDTLIEPTVATEQIERFEVRICDGDNGSGVNLEACQVELHHEDMPVRFRPMAPPAYEDMYCGILYFDLYDALEIGGDDDGRYRLTVISVDVAGNSITEYFTFEYRTVDDLDDPVIDSVSVINPDAVTLATDTASPFELGNVFESVANVRASISDPAPSTGIASTSYIELINPDGNPVNGISSLAYEGSIVRGINFNLTTDLATDGSDDGAYTANIYVADNAGNSVEDTARFTLNTFTEEPQAPIVDGIWPEDGAILNEHITEVYAVLEDRSGAGIDYERTTIEVDPPSGVPTWWRINGYQYNDEDAQTIFWRFNQALPTDGRSDGEYEIEVRVYDNDGRRSQRLESRFVYDTRPPVVATVEMGARPWLAANYQSVTELRAGGTRTPLNRLDVKLEDKPAHYEEPAGVDILSSSVEIVGPNGSLITEQTHDGLDTIVSDFPILADDGTDDGVYLINITAVDNLGNTNPFPFVPPYTYTFIYDTRPPELICALAVKDGDDVTSVEPLPVAGNPTPLFGDCLAGEKDQIPRVLNAVDTIKLKFRDPDVGVGVDMIATAETIFVYGPHGQIPGTRSIEEDGVGVFKFDEPLETADASDDGVYTVKARLVDEVGNMANIEFDFEYRAMAPLLVDIEVTTSDDEVFSLTDDDYRKFEKSVDRVKAILADRSGKGLDFDESFIAVQGPGVSLNDSGENNGDDILEYVFAEPFANDGSDDGEYMVFVRAVDLDGHWEEYLRWFNFDTSPPEVVEVMAGSEVIFPSADETETPVFADALSRVSAKLRDETEVDLFGSSISMQAPVSIASTVVNNGVDTIALQFFQLADNGTADGLYTISVEPTDMLGCKHPEPLVFEFIYDTTPPQVISTTPVASSNVDEQMNNIIVIFSDGAADSTSGVDLDACTLKLSGPDGVVAGTITREPPNTLIFVPDSPFADDGSDDGTYMIEATAQDRAGNVTTDSVELGFSYVTSSPAVAASTPADGQWVMVPISFVSAVLVDNSGEGLNLEQCAITLIGPDGETVPGTHGSQEPDTITYTLDNLLATDRSADGVYMLDITAADNRGTTVRYLRSFGYDRTPPTAANTFPADGDVLKDSIAFISVQLDDAGSGVNLENSVVSLTGPGQITASKVNDGVDTIKLEFEPLTADGQYVISVAPTDQVGNSVLSPYSFSFIYDTTAPTVVRTEPAEGETVISALDRVSATLNDIAGSGLDLSATEIHLHAPDGTEVFGVTTTNNADTLFLAFPVRSNDGSDDGIYTITVMARDQIGNAGSTSIAFEYRTVDPVLVDVEVVSEDAVLSLAGDEPQQFEKSVIEIRSIIEDKSGSGLDFGSTLVGVEGPAVSELDTIDNNGEDTVTYTFAEPLANDGSDDGTYMIYVRAVDNEGHWADYTASFYFDSGAPEVVSTIPADGAVFNNPISEVSATLADAMSDIDLFNSSISLSAPVSIKAEQVNDGVDTIALRFFEIADDGSADGLYTISVEPVDILNNDLPEPYTFTFIFDTTCPSVASTMPASGEVVIEPLEQVTVILSDGQSGTMAGVDLSACSLELTGPDGEPVDGELSKEEPDTLIFTLAAADDLPADGTYTIKVTARDAVGNASDPILIEFMHVIRSPVVIATTPANGSAFATPIASVTAILVDNSGTGLDLENSMVTLTAPDGEIVAGTHSISEPDTVVYTLVNDLSTDGADDGEYTLDIRGADKTGVTASYKTNFIYDTIPPSVSAISPADGDVMKQSINHVTVQFADAGSGVSLLNSTVQLKGPAGDILGSQVNDGVDAIEYRFAPLTADGHYNINVVPADEVGNVPIEPQVFSFIYDTTPPVVKQTKPANGETVLVALDSVSVELDDASCAGVDAASCIIELKAPDGSLIPGTREDDGDTLVLTFSALAIDGGGNGTYTITVVTHDLIGNVSGTQNFRFTYLPTAPNVVAMTPMDGSFTATPMESVTVVLEDRSGSGINFDSTWIKVLSPGDQEVAGEMLNDGVASLFFNLQNPFSTDGTDDGDYSVEIQPVDNEGNAALIVKKFSYDTTPGTVSSVYVGDAENGIMLETHAVIPSDFGIVNQVSAVIQDAVAGVDLNQSTMRLLNPLGLMIDAEQQNNGVDTISLNFDAVIQFDGLYMVFITPVDKLGNAAAQEKLYTFMVDTAAPEISNSIPKIGATVVNRKLEEVVIELDDGEGSGVDADMLLVQLSGLNGEIAGELEVQYDDSDTQTCTLLYKLSTPLAMDASDDGEYVIKIWFADVAKNGNMTADGPGEPAILYFTYDTVQPGGPVINNMGVFPGAFSPNGDGTYDDITISYVLSKDANVKLLIYDSNRTLVTALLDMEPRLAGMNSVVWDGVVSGDAGDYLLPDGMYLIKIDAVDDRGLTGAVESSSVIIDTRPPSVDRPLISNNPFTPDGDGFADAAAISFVVNGSEPQDSVTVAIYNQSLEKIASPGLNEPFSGDGDYFVVWDGEGANIDGEYTFIITAQDAAGNMREISGTVAMDKSGPVIQVLSPESHVLCTNQSPIVLSGSATDWGGVRSVSMVGLFTPAESTGSIGNTSISNWVKMTYSGDKIDNDGDGEIDEEEFNGKDDDGDGLVDEDLVAEDGKTVYWTHRLVPQTNGEYIIRFRALDPIEHASDYSETLRIVYDIAPPLHVNTVAESSSSGQSDNARVKNGDLVIITTTWDQPEYQITVDLSQLDSTLEEPLTAGDRGNGKYVVEYPVSRDNTHSDGSKTIIITAEDAAGNKTVRDTFHVRLRNDLPVVESLSSPDGSASYANGATVRILARCDVSDLLVSADFSELDSTYTSEKVRVTNNGDNTYLIEYTIGVDNTMLDRPSVPIVITFSDGLGSISSEYLVSLDNAAPLMEMVRVKQNDEWSEVVLSGGAVFSANVAFANGDTVEVETIWDVSGYEISADFSSMDSTYKPGAESVESLGLGSPIYIISYKLGDANNMPDGVDNTVIINATDPAGNESQYILRLNLDNTAPDILSVSSADDDTVYKNGDTVAISVKLDAAGYRVSGDFSALDSTYANRANEVYVTDNGDGTYLIKYSIHKENKLGVDSVVSNIHITVTAVDSVGNSTTDSSMTVKLDNIPPELEIENPASDALVFGARIQVKGKTEPDAAVTVEPKGVINSTPDVLVGNDGTFDCQVALSVGYNTITVTASDVAGNLTIEKLTILYQPLIKAADGGIIYLPEKKDDGIADNDTRVVVPAGATNRDFTVEIAKLESPPQAVDNPAIGEGVLSPLVAYEFTMKDESGDQQVSLAFVKSIQLRLQYQGLKMLDGPAVVFRWDGVRWNRIGGEEDRENGTVTVTVNSLSIFGIFRGTTVTEFVLRGAFPNPFTPNDDGVNDVVSFYLDNPGNSETTIRIFDLRGALVRRLDNGLSSWDGTDDVAEPAEMGVYIYQVEIDGEVKGGTIVLAK